MHAIGSPLMGRKILIVEDFEAATGLLSPVQRLDHMDIFGRTLRRAGAVVDVRASVYQAQQRLHDLQKQGHVPHVILTDYHLMGSETGVDLARWLLIHPTLKICQRVLLTAALHVAQAQAVACQTTLDQLFVRSYAKPVDMRHLISDLATLLSPPLVATTGPAPA